MSLTTSVPAHARQFEKRTTFKKTTASALKAFHERRDIFAKLAPPPLIIQVRRDDRTSLTEGDLEFTLWFAFFPVKWWARHEPGPTPLSFADLMIAGPMAYWRHEHIFNDTPDGAELIDRITLAHHPGLRGVLSRIMFDGPALAFLFFYRHLRTGQHLR